MKPAIKFWLFTLWPLAVPFLSMPFYSLTLKPWLASLGVYHHSVWIMWLDAWPLYDVFYIVLLATFLTALYYWRRSYRHSHGAMRYFSFLLLIAGVLVGCLMGLDVFFSSLHRPWILAELGLPQAQYAMANSLEWELEANMLDALGGDMDTRFQVTEKDIREWEYKAAAGGCFAAMYWYIEPNLDKRSPSSNRDKIDTTHAWSAQERKWLLEATDRGSKEAQITASRIYRYDMANKLPDTAKENFHHSKLMRNISAERPSAYPSCDNVGITPLP